VGRFLLYLLVFVIGGVIGFAVGGFMGVAGGAYVGACKVVDQAVTSNTMTQDQANALIKSIATELEIRPEDKDRIVQAIKRADQPSSPCSTAIQAL
jgi:outer membrane lipoprotein SlyB